MAAFSESLTVRILGDSSQFQRELETVTQRISNLTSQLNQLSTANQHLGRSVSQLSRLVQPLRVITSLFNQISSQAQLISQLSINIDTRPAVISLLSLSRMITAIGQQIRNLSGGISLPSAKGQAPQNPRLSQGFAQGGLVTGPTGIDRVPAMLTAGEFVMRRTAVDRIGTTFLNALNQNRHSDSISSPSTGPPTGNAVNQSTVNNFGGISLNVSRPVDLNAIVRDLRFQGFHLRNRRG